ncbi:MAG: large-conductance mechanosensitive channel protein MscL [Bacteroidia bacterium]|nr:large-conductance mechanosensitive channel protein MscL [Bacteroidia bacterium]
MMQEFKTFAVKGNLVDMAVGIIIGGAFGKIVSSFVADVVMPPIGMLMGNVDFKDLKIVLQEGKEAVEGGQEAVAEVAIKWGAFANVVIDFIIVAFVIFMVIKGMNKLKKQEEAAPAPAPAEPEPTREEILLGEIRDLLKKN